jgi:uncharacterized Zn finger protein
MATTGESETEIENDDRWWSERWWAVMESIGAAHRLESGKHYARSERVFSLEIAPGLVSADVQGSRYEPYHVEIGVDAFTDSEWHEVIDALASQALFSAKLLAGEMPENIEEALSGLGLSLFPNSQSELTMACSCLDTMVPCKHIAAIHYVLADKLDADPFLLFEWRGRSRERILRELRQQRAAEASGRPHDRSSTRSLEDSMAEYWKLGESFDTVTVTVGPPAVSASLLKRLGVPSCWQQHPEIRGALERLYAKVTERAMALAYSGRGMREPDSDD